MNSFSVAVREKLGYYVYLYVDPRTDQIFYVGVWRLSIERVQTVQYAFAVFNNVVREVYEASGWFEAGQTAYFTRSLEDVEVPERIEFVGRVAPEAVRKRYLFKSVGEYFLPGSSNPVQYIHC